MVAMTSESSLSLLGCLDSSKASDSLPLLATPVGEEGRKGEDVGSRLLFEIGLVQCPQYCCPHQRSGFSAADNLKKGPPEKTQEAEFDLNFR